MSGFRIATVAAIALVAVSGALAEPAGRGGKAKAPRAPTWRAPPSEGGYFVPYATGPSGAKYPVMNIPGSVTVVPRALMDDQNATSLGQALRNVPGVTVIGR